MSPTQITRSTTEMMTDIMGNVGNLVRGEVDLARAEIGDSIDKASSTLPLMAVAVALAITGLNVLAAMLISLLVLAGLSTTWATLAVGLGLILLAVIIFLSVKATLRQIGFIPTRTARNVKHDATAIKDSLQ